ncbi:hypothetical protein PAXRUDRAFT_152523 [Paxillus rubicundulus Ve08.2h10]|uniref:Uncharacterized protein n=1 Tax=Paxillus rubicundulus Ve08.2h10 TaxID=930991 RepID=A0A0D0DBH8_9AGAM|nr:hypothetical protein PAXRUDRAFT_152523 [Paxillus rubicundulus Ve08.2h10]
MLPPPPPTEKLISWLLSHTPERVVIFYDKKDCSRQECTGPQSKPSGSTKKLVQAAITKELFETDPTYGTIYASNQEKFALAIQSYSNQLMLVSALVTDPAHQNLMHESYLSSVFPYFKDCDAMWCNNPSYNSRPFNFSPSTDCSGDFLSLIKHGSASTSSQLLTVPNDPHDLPKELMHDNQPGDSLAQEQKNIPDGQPDDWGVNPNAEMRGVDEDFEGQQ